MRDQLVENGLEPSPRCRTDVADVWLFFAARGHAVVGGRECTSPPRGTVVYTPTRRFHRIINTGDEPVKLYFLYVPGGGAQAILDATFR